MSIIAYPLEATEYTAEDVQSYLSTRTSGVYSDEITFTPEGMAVTVSPFLAWFNYEKFKGCSVAVTEPETLTFSPAHAILDRIDRIVLRLDLSINKAYLTVIEGVASSSPVPPNIKKTKAVNDISPVYVKIKAGATEITHADITSTILDESVCGIMRDGVTGIPTAQLQSQAEALILRLHEVINDVEADTACMLRDLYDPEDKAKPVAFDDEVFKTDGSNSFVASNAFFGNGYSRIYGTSWAAFLGHQDAPKDINNGRALMIQSQIKADLHKSAKLVDTSNGTTKNYVIFGEHNKPSGSYIGSGSSQRQINIGDSVGNVLYVDSDFGDSLVCEGGALILVQGGIRVDNNAIYSDGILYLNTSDEALNAKNATYFYSLL